MAHGSESGTRQIIIRSMVPAFFWYNNFHTTLLLLLYFVLRTLPPTYRILHTHLLSPAHTHVLERVQTQELDVRKTLNKSISE